LEGFFSLAQIWNRRMELDFNGEKDRRRFRDAVVERMIDRTLRDDGTCFETFRRINVLARK